MCVYVEVVAGLIGTVRENAHENHAMQTNVNFTIVLKPAPAWRVDPGPGRPRHETGPGGGQNLVGN